MMSSNENVCKMMTSHFRTLYVDNIGSPQSELLYIFFFYLPNFVFKHFLTRSNLEAQEAHSSQEVQGEDRRFLCLNIQAEYFPITWQSRDSHVHVIGFM